mmetsp:Transcript_46623/g.110871  ORF Transcript_46623/g.110871 Transcript_46623/m.110871 type:complete len:641 (-) Transcript_46623:202-2124(-)
MSDGEDEDEPQVRLNTVEAPDDWQTVRAWEVPAPKEVLSAAKQPHHPTRFVVFKVGRDQPWAELLDGASFTFPKQRSRKRKRSIAEVISNIDKGVSLDELKDGGGKYRMVTQDGYDLAVEADSASASNLMPVIPGQKDGRANSVEIAGRTFTMVRLLPRTCSKDALNPADMQDSLKTLAGHPSALILKPRAKEKVCLMEVQCNLFPDPAHEIAPPELQIHAFKVDADARKKDKGNEGEKDSKRHLVATFTNAPDMKMKGYKVKDSSGGHTGLPGTKFLLGVNLADSREMSVYETDIFSMATYKRNKNVEATEKQSIKDMDWQAKMAEKMDAYDEFGVLKKRTVKNKYKDMKEKLANVAFPEETAKILEERRQQNQVDEPEMDKKEELLTYKNKYLPPFNAETLDPTAIYRPAGLEAILPSELWKTGDIPVDPEVVKFFLGQKPALNAEAMTKLFQYRGVASIAYWRIYEKKQYASKPKEAERTARKFAVLQMLVRLYKGRKSTKNFEFRLDALARALGIQDVESPLVSHMYNTFCEEIATGPGAAKWGVKTLNWRKLLCYKAVWAVHLSPDFRVDIETWTDDLELHRDTLRMFYEFIGCSVSKKVSKDPSQAPCAWGRLVAPLSLRLNDFGGKKKSGGKK